MLTRFQKIILSASFLVMMNVSSAFAVGVDVVGAGTYFMGTGTPAVTSALGFPGGGLIFNFRLGSKVDLALGGLYLTSTYNDGLAAAQANTGINGQLGFKFRFTRGLFIDVGGFYNYSMTSAQTLTGSNYGVAAGLGIQIPLSSSVGFLIHPQYQYALANLSNADGSVVITPSQLVGMVGFTFGMSSK